MEYDGYSKVELSQIALTEDGIAHGLVKSTLSQGSEKDAFDKPDPDRVFRLRIASPNSGSSFEKGQKIQLKAEIEIEKEEIPPSRITWFRQDSEKKNPELQIGKGQELFVEDLPLGLHLIGVRAISSDKLKREAKKIWRDE